MINDNSKIDVTVGLNWWQKSLYYFIYSILYVFSLLPLGVLYVFSDGLYFLVYHVVGYRKRIVRKNLKDSFPEKSDAELLAVEKKFYHFFCDYIYETIKLTSVSKKELERRIHITGEEKLQAWCGEGKSVIAYLGHYCNWEWVIGASRVFPDDSLGGQVYHILEDKVFNALLLKIRSTMGTESISMQMILRRIIQEKKAGHKMILGFISDQVPLYQATRHWLTFLNHEGTLVITGTEQIIKKCDFACMYFDLSRPRRGYYNIDMVPMLKDTKDVPDWQITDMYFSLFEKTIKRAPEYWLWTHNRWKRTYGSYMKWLEEKECKDKNYE